MKERRKKSRMPIVVQINYHTVDSFFRDFADDLSAEGMFIATQEPLEPGTKLSLEFLIPGCKYPIRVRAEVIWNRNVYDMGRGRGMGVKFEGLSPSEKDKINTIVRQLRSVP
jgi:uncharacterized protein (TIGR02266 family)